MDRASGYFSQRRASLLSIALVAAGVCTALTLQSGEAASVKACRAADGCFPKRPGSGPGSTGIRPGTELRTCGEDVTVRTRRKVIDGCRYTGNVTIAADGVRIRNSRILGAIRTQGGATDFRFTVEDSEIGPEEGCGSFEALIGVRNYVARRNYLHSNGDGFRLAGDDITIKHNFVETCDLPGDHSDGIQGFGTGAKNVVDHNTIDLRGSRNGPNAPIFIADYSRSATITDNLLISRGNRSAALRVHDDRDPDVGPWIVTGNRLVGGVITTNTECRAATMRWSDNRQVQIDGDYEVIETARRALRC